jgi:hypothetical protein
MSADDEMLATPLVYEPDSSTSPPGPAERPPAPASVAWSNAPITMPVRPISIRDVAQLIRRDRSGALAAGATENTYVVRDAVDHPWRGRKETWYDYLSPDGHWKRVCFFELPFRCLFFAALTIVTGLVILRTDSPRASLQIGALGAPVSAFSLLTSLILTVSGTMRPAQPSYHARARGRMRMRARRDALTKPRPPHSRTSVPLPRTRCTVPPLDRLLAFLGRQELHHEPPRLDALCRVFIHRRPA